MCGVAYLDECDEQYEQGGWAARVSVGVVLSVPVVGEEVVGDLGDHAGEEGSLSLPQQLLAVAVLHGDPETTGALPAHLCTEEKQQDKYKTHTQTVFNLSIYFPTDCKETLMRCCAHPVSFKTTKLIIPFINNILSYYFHSQFAL